MNCPFCKGRGRQRPDAQDRELGFAGILCEPCGGTGDYETAKLMRATRLGETAGYSRALSRLTHSEPTPRLGWETIRSAVVDDMRRQRHEEALEVDSVERRQLEMQITNLMRERVPLLASLGELAAELREQIATEVPA